MTTVSASKFISAPKEAVWQVISNTDSELNCWSAIRSISMVDQERRQVSTIFGFKFIESIDMEPKKSIIVHILDGPFTGAKTIELKAVDNDNSTIVDISWNIHVNGTMRIFSFFVQRYVIIRQTRNTLERIAQIIIAADRIEQKHRS